MPPKRKRLAHSVPKQRHIQAHSNTFEHIRNKSHLRHVRFTLVKAQTGSTFTATASTLYNTKERRSCGMQARALLYSPDEGVVACKHVHGFTPVLVSVSVYVSAFVFVFVCVSVSVAVSDAVSIFVRAFAFASAPNWWPHHVVWFDPRASIMSGSQKQ